MALVDVMNGRQLEREEQRAQASSGELGHSVSYPSFCVIAQGSKLIHRSAWKECSAKLNFRLTEF